MQLKAEEFCILITNRTPSSGQPPLEERIVRARIHTCIYMCDVGFSRRDFDLQAGEYFIIGGIMQRFGISSEEAKIFFDRGTKVGRYTWKWSERFLSTVRKFFDRETGTSGWKISRWDCIYARKLFFERIVRLSFYSKFLDDDCHIIKLNNVITV